MATKVIALKVSLTVDVDEWELNYGVSGAELAEDVRVAAADALLYLGAGSVKMVQRKN